MFGTHHPHRRLARVLVAGVAVSGALAGVAWAFPIASSGTSQVSMQNVAENVASLYNLAAWADIPGASAVVSVPTGGSRLINARFTAESQCNGPGAGNCYVRIVARNGAAELQLNPIDNLAVFDTDQAGGSDDALEAHAIERSRRISQVGNWTIVVQRSVAGGSSFILDDWHVAVETTA